MSAAVSQISPASLSDMLAKKSVYLADVREGFEFRREHVAEAVHCPASSLDPDQILKAAGKTGAVCVMCASGGRSAKAAKTLSDAAGVSKGAYGDVKIFDLAGGMSAWRNNKLPVIEDTRAPLPIIRQVHLIASTIILSGCVLTRFYNPNFILMPLMVGCGLFVSGSTGFCGMAAVLQHLPYNKNA